MSGSECTVCPDYVIRCSRLGEYRVVLAPTIEGYGAALWRRNSVLSASIATSKDWSEMEAHFGELDELMRDGALEKLMEFAENMPDG